MKMTRITNNYGKDLVDNFVTKANKRKSHQETVWNDQPHRSVVFWIIYLHNVYLCTEALKSSLVGVVLNFTKFTKIIQKLLLSTRS